MLVKKSRIGLHTEGIGACGESFERDFEVAGEGRLGIVVAKDGATQRIDEQELRGRDAGERELHVADGGVGMPARLLAVVSCQMAKKVQLRST